MLLCGSTFAIVEEALATIGSDQSLLADPATAESVATLPGNTVSVMAVIPSSLELSAALSIDQVGAMQTLFDESDAATGPMPESTLLLFGITAGLSAVPADTTQGTPEPPNVDAGEGLVVIRIATASDEEAAQAVAVVEHRWSTWQSMVTPAPLEEFMTIVSTGTEGAVGMIDLVPTASSGAWRQMVAAGDLLPFVTELPAAS